MIQFSSRHALASRNVQDFVSAGKTVQVIGPAVFSGDLPTDTPVSARIESGRVRDGAFELKLSNLATNKHYIIENLGRPCHAPQGFGKAAEDR